MQHQEGGRQNGRAGRVSGSWLWMWIGKVVVMSKGCLQWCGIWVSGGAFGYGKGKYEREQDRPEYELVV